MKKFKVIVLVFLAIMLLSLVPHLTQNQNKQSVGNEILKNTKSDTKAQNSVSAIVFDYRGYDTLGEATVLFTAILGTSVILRKSNKTTKEDEK